jgi:hypothetical protein
MTLKRLVFLSADKSWLKFVMNNRTHLDFIHDYDLVAGSVANDRVYAALSLFKELVFVRSDRTGT